MNDDFEKEMLNMYKDIFNKVYKNLNGLSDSLDEFNIIDFSIQEQLIFDMIMESEESLMNRLGTLYNMLVISKMKHKPLAEWE